MSTFAKTTVVILIVKSVILLSMDLEMKDDVITIDWKLPESNNGEKETLVLTNDIFKEALKEKKGLVSTDTFAFLLDLSKPSEILSKNIHLGKYAAPRMRVQRKDTMVNPFEKIDVALPVCEMMDSAGKFDCYYPFIAMTFVNCRVLVIIEKEVIKFVLLIKEDALSKNQNSHDDSDNLEDIIIDNLNLFKESPKQLLEQRNENGTSGNLTTASVSTLEMNKSQWGNFGWQTELINKDIKKTTEAELEDNDSFVNKHKANFDARNHNFVEFEEIKTHTDGLVSPGLISQQKANFVEFEEMGIHTDGLASPGLISQQKIDDALSNQTQADRTKLRQKELLVL